MTDEGETGMPEKNKPVEAEEKDAAEGPGPTREPMAGPGDAPAEGRSGGPVFVAQVTGAAPAELTAAERTEAGDRRAVFALVAAVAALAVALAALGFAYHVFKRAVGYGHSVDSAKDDIRVGERSWLRRLDAAKDEQRTLSQKVLRLNKELATLQEKSKTDRAFLAEVLEAQAKQLTIVTEKLTAEREKQQKVDREQNRNLAVTQTNLGTVSKRLVYVEQRLTALDVLETDLNALRGDTGALRGELTALRRDLLAVEKRGAVTEKELGELDERAHLFQLRILTARAREAARAARRGDLKNLLEKLDDLPE